MHGLMPRELVADWVNTQAEALYALHHEDTLDFPPPEYTGCMPVDVTGEDCHIVTIRLAHKRQTYTNPWEGYPRHIYVLTGGLEITLTVPQTSKFDHNAAVRTFTSRVAKGWAHSQVVKRLHGMLRNADYRYKLNIRRAETLTALESFMDAMHEDPLKRQAAYYMRAYLPECEMVAGHTTTLDNMTMECCKYWDRWLWDERVRADMVGQVWRWIQLVPTVGTILFDRLHLDAVEATETRPDGRVRSKVRVTPIDAPGEPVAFTIWVVPTAAWGPANYWVRDSDREEEDRKQES